MPQYWLFTVLLSVIALLAPNLLRSARFDPLHILCSLFFIPHWTESTGFSPIVKLGWTLNFEMLFYLLFYVAMKICHRHREVICSALMILICVLINIASPDPHHPLAFYGDSIIIEFVFGLLLGMLYRQGRIEAHRMPLAVFVPVMMCFLGVFYLATYADGSRLPRFMMFGLPALLMVMFFLYSEELFQGSAMWIKEVIMTGGDVSYPLYLVHIYFIAVLSRVMGWLHLGVAEIFLCTLILSSLVSYAILHVFDAPVRKRLLRHLTTTTG